MAHGQLQARKGRTMFRTLSSIVFALGTFCVQAQNLTTAQLSALNTCINAVPEWAALPNNSDTASTIAAGLNQTAAPSWIVWRKRIPATEIGLTINYVAVAAMTTANLDRVKTFIVLNPVDFDPARSDIRTYMSDTFSGALGGQGQATRDALEAMYRRSASSGEKCLSTGTGTTVSPAALGYEGTFTFQQVQDARSL